MERKNGTEVLIENLHYSAQRESLSITSESSKRSILDVVPSVSKLNDGVNVDIELSKVGNLGIEGLASLGIGVEVGGFAEEVSTETLVAVVKNAILVSVVEGGGILNDKLDLPDEVALGTLGGASLLGLLVVGLNSLAVCGLNLNNEERGSEGSGGLALVEQFVEGGVLEASVLGGNFRDSDSVSWGGRGKFSSVLLLVFGDLSEALGDLAGSNEGGDVRVVAECEDLLAG